MTTTISTLDIVRRHVGRRHTITRNEMAAILIDAVPDLPNASTIALRNRDGSLYVGDASVEPVTEDRPELPPSMRAVDVEATAVRERDATAAAWTRLCRGITVISVLPTEFFDGDALRVALGVRYDTPGSMHPMQQAQITFVSESAAQRRPTLDYLRHRAERVLIVRD